MPLFLSFIHILIPFSYLNKHCCHVVWGTLLGWCRKSVGSACRAGLMAEHVPGSVAGVLGPMLRVCRDVLPGCWVNVSWSARMCCRVAGLMSHGLPECVAGLPG